MNHSTGYEDGSTRVCKLQRSLYGLKQAPRCWNKKFKNMLHSFNLQETNTDSCVFISKKNNHLLIVAIFVDDGHIAASTDEQVNDMVRCLKDNFETKERDLDQFLGIEVNSKIDGSIFIHQTSYCVRIISKFNMEGANVVYIPTNPQHTLDSTVLEIGSTQAEEVPYREQLGVCCI